MLQVTFLPHNSILLINKPSRSHLISSITTPPNHHQLNHSIIAHHLSSPPLSSSPTTTMAPTKKDSSSASTTDSTATDNAKLTPAQSSSLILSYLQQQNRPYSAIDISANLKNRVTKTAAVKLLKDLHERGEIEGRVAGKGVVYHAVQVSMLQNLPLLQWVVVKNP
jgi:hypothetical protein